MVVWALVVEMIWIGEDYGWSGCDNVVVRVMAVLV